MKVEVDCEDAASVILFIDTFLPMLDKKDAASRDASVNVFRVRQELHKQLGPLGSHISPGMLP